MNQVFHCPAEAPVWARRWVVVSSTATRMDKLFFIRCIFHKNIPFTTPRDRCVNKQPLPVNKRQNLAHCSYRVCVKTGALAVSEVDLLRALIDRFPPLVYGNGRSIEGLEERQRFADI